MAILTYADFRSATALYPDVVLSVAEAADARITTEIATQVETFQLITGDVYESATTTSTTYAGTGTSLLLTYNHPHLVTISSVAVVDLDGTSTTLDTDSYKVFEWGIERFDGGSFGYDQTVALTTVAYGNAAVPGYVKRAIALMVYEVLKGTNVGKHHAIRWQTGDTVFEVDPDSPTGIPEVDRIIRFHRGPKLRAV